MSEIDKELSSPKPEADGYVQQGISDLYPDRKKRLGDYISNLTKGNITEDTEGGRQNRFPISFDTHPQESFVGELENALNEAVNYFENLSEQYGIPNAASQPNFDGHKKIINTGIGNNTRWETISNNNPSFRRRTSEAEWEEYYQQRMLVGEKLILEASGEGYNIKSSLGGEGVTLLSDDISVKEILENIIKEGKSGEQSSKIYNKYTYGQSNNPNNKFTVNLGDSVGELVKIAAMLLDIWLTILAKTIITRMLLTIGHYAGSLVSDPMQEKWRNNIFAWDYLKVQGTTYKKGSSGNIPHYVDGIDEVLKDSVGTSAGDMSQMQKQIGTIFFGAGIETLSTIEDGLDYISAGLLKELNFYYPRHMLTALVSNYKNAKWDNRFNVITFESLGDNWIQGDGVDKKLIPANAMTIYLQALTAGFLKFVIQVSTDTRSIGYYKNLFKVLLRSKGNKSFWDTAKFWDDPMTSLRSIFGSDDRIINFSNYLVMVGDLSIAAGSIGSVGFTENKVLLEYLGDYPTLRGAKSRVFHEADKKWKSPLSIHLLPSLRIEEATRYTNKDLKYDIMLEKEKEDIKKAKITKRFSSEDVEEIENILEAEMMPFYIQDLRTNEIIAFHAFLESMEDSYTAEWSAIKGFGRVEPAQIYGGGSRSIGCSFTMVSLNEEDFHEMYYKINKLTTLVYPQWSEGTKMENTQFSGEGNANGQFIQPFSQIPTASPMCRIRVGDIFTSNFTEDRFFRLSGSDTIQLSDNYKTNNPMLQSFKSGMGRGIAVAINSIGIDWKLNTVPWNLTAGERAPKMCTISLGLIPIHDITPGLDHLGRNRAPIYNVGPYKREDPWNTTGSEKETLDKDIENNHSKALSGIQPKVENSIFSKVKNNE